MTPEAVFEDLRQWLGDRGLLGRIRTQLAALIATDDVRPVGLATALLVMQADALAAQALTETLASAWTQLARFHSSLVALESALTLEVDAMHPIRKSGSLNPEQIRRAAQRRAQACVVLVASVSAMPEPATSIKSLGELATNAKVAFQQLETLEQRCAYEPPPDTRVLLDVLEVCKAHQQLIALCMDAGRVGGPEPLLLLAQQADELGLPVYVTADALALADQFVVRSAPDPKDALLLKACRQSLAAWPAGAAPRMEGWRLFLHAFSSKQPQDGQRDRWSEFMMAHAGQVEEGDSLPADALDLVHMAICCTFFRWGKENNYDASTLIDAVLHHPANVDRVVLKPEWSKELGLPSKGLPLRSFNDVMSYRRKNKISGRPRFAASYASVAAGTLAQVARVSEDLRAKRQLLWPVALASKIGYFYHAKALLPLGEPAYRDDKDSVARKTADRMRKLALYVQPQLPRVTIESHAARFFSEAPVGEIFSSRAWGADWPDHWLFGQSVTRDVEAACAACSRLHEDTLQEALNLFCRPILVPPEGSGRARQLRENSRRLQVLQHLARSDKEFERGLWWPLTLPVDHPHHAVGADVYFGQVGS